MFLIASCFRILISVVIFKKHPTIAFVLSEYKNVVATTSIFTHIGIFEYSPELNELMTFPNASSDRLIAAPSLSR